MREKREPGRTVWREGEKEQKKQPISDNREKEDVARMFTKLVTKHIYALLSRETTGGGSEHGVGRSRVGPTFGPTVLGSERLSGPTISFCIGKRQVHKEEV